VREEAAGIVESEGTEITRRFVRIDHNRALDHVIVTMREKVIRTITAIVVDLARNIIDNTEQND